MDYFIWGHLKGRLYWGQRFPSPEVLVERIEEEAGAIPVVMIRSALENFWDRLPECEMRGGLSVETRD
jgi:hypothetical protein